MQIQTIVGQLTTFTTIFLGIFIEATPFLLLGTLASGLVEIFIDRNDVARIFPRGVLLAALTGSLLGFVFPVCECGVVPLVRRLFNKGLPIPAGIAFLLAAPIANPVVLVSTYAAYGWGKVLAARLVLGLIVAVIVGAFFSLNPDPVALTRAPFTTPAVSVEGDGPLHRLAAEPLPARLRAVSRIATDEFFEMSRYLILGSMLAALLQTVVPQTVLLALGSGPVLSVFVMLVLAYVLCVCSTVDAFLSLAFVNTFTTGAILGFLVFGPMVDIKSTLMFMRVFKGRVVIYLVILPFLLTALFAVFINLNLAW